MTITVYVFSAFNVNGRRWPLFFQFWLCLAPLYQFVQAPSSPWASSLHYQIKQEREQKGSQHCCAVHPPEQYPGSHPAPALCDHRCLKTSCVILYRLVMGHCYFPPAFCLFVWRMLVGSFDKWWLICLKFLVWYLPTWLESPGSRRCTLKASDAGWSCSWAKPSSSGLTVAGYHS